MSSTVNTPLTRLERAKVAAAVGATVEMPGQAFLNMCEVAEGARAICENHAAAETEARALLAEGQRCERAGAEMVGKAREMVEIANRIEARAKRFFGLAIIGFGLGLGLCIAGVIL